MIRHLKSLSLLGVMAASLACGVAHAEVWVPSDQWGQSWRNGTFTKGNSADGEVIQPPRHGGYGVTIITPGGAAYGYGGQGFYVNGYGANGQCVLPACQVQQQQQNAQNSYHCNQSNDGSLSCGYGKDVPPNQ